MTDIFALHARPAHPLLGVPGHTVLVPGGVAADTPASVLETTLRIKSRFGTITNAAVDAAQLADYDGAGIPEWPRARQLARWAAEHGYAISYSRYVAALDGELRFSSRFLTETQYTLAINDPWLVLGTHISLSDTVIGYAVPGGGRRAEGMIEAEALLERCEAWLVSRAPDAPGEIGDAVAGVASVARYAVGVRLDVGWR